MIYANNFNINYIWTDYTITIHANVYNDIATKAAAQSAK
jgi:hypothetical protein